MCPRYDSVSADQHPDWQAAYRAALLEVDPAKLPERIEQADRAIHHYMDLARQDNSSGAEGLWRVRWPTCVCCDAKSV